MKVGAERSMADPSRHTMPDGAPASDVNALYLYGGSAYLVIIWKMELELSGGRFVGVINVTL